MALILVGLLLVGRTLDLFWFSFGELIRMLLPLGIIGLGVWLILRKKKMLEHAQSAGSASNPTSNTDKAYSGPKVDINVGASATADPAGEQQPTQPSHTGSFTSSTASTTPERGPSGQIKYSKLVGDIFIDCNGVDLCNIEVSVFLGDLEMKLDGGKLTCGLNRVIISGFVGDARIFIPRGMPYFVCCSSFIGDVDIHGKRSGGFGTNVEAQSEDYATAESKVYLAVNEFIGDIRIYVI